MHIDNSKIPRKAKDLRNTPSNHASTSRRARKDTVAETAFKRRKSVLAREQAARDAKLPTAAIASVPELPQNPELDMFTTPGSHSSAMHVAVAAEGSVVEGAFSPSATSPLLVDSTPVPKAADSMEVSSRQERYKSSKQKKREEKEARRAEKKAKKAAASTVSETNGQGSGKTKKKKKKKNKRAKHKTPIWQILMLLIGLALLAYPIIADRISAYQADQAITSYTEQVSQDPAESNRLLDQAQAYNDRLSGTPNDYAGEVPPESELIVGGGLAFSWIEFPTLAEKLPIYHGTSDSVLQAGVGNLERTSIPIGGVSTHSVLTGHSGMPGSRMFDDIDRLAIGDVFMIHTLNLDMAYKVISTEVVWPDEVNSLAIQPGRDLVTLITCTPYGVNDHRLLVHAERTDYDEALELPSNNMALFFNQRTIPFILAIIGIALFFFIMTVRRRMKYPLELGVDAAWNGLSDYTDDKRRYVGEKNRI